MPDDPAMIPDPGVGERIAGLVERTRTVVARRRAARLAAGALAAGVLLAIALAVADACLDLPAWLRLVLAVLAAGGALAAPPLIGLLAGLLRPDAQRALALAEAAVGDVHRRLTTAGELAAMPGVLAATAAAHFAATVPADADPAAGLPPARAARLLWVVPAAAAAALAIHLVFPNLWPMVLPRLADPFGDHPPYSATRLAWIDPPATARPGETPRLAVRSDGPAPRELLLRGAGEGVAVEIAAPLVQMGPDRWEVALAPLPAPDGAGPSALVLWAEGAGTRTPRHRIRLDPVPVLKECACTLASPAYARLPDEKRTATAAAPAAFAALPGSRLALAPRANRACTAVWLAHDDEEPRRLPLADGRVELPDPAPGRWSIALEAAGGVRGDRVAVAALTRRTDQPPTVHFELPASEALATPGAAVTVVIQAEDDLGLAALTRYVVVGEQRSEEHVDTLGGTGDTWRGSQVMRGVKPGDVVRLGAVARDTLPPDGQLSKPDERRVRIISDRQYNDLIRDQLASDALVEKYRPLLEQLAAIERDTAAAPPGETAEQRQQRLAELAERTQRLLAETSGLRRPEHVFASEKALLDAIEQRIRQLRQRQAGGPEPGGEDAGAMLQDLEELTGLAEDDALQDRLRDLAAAERALAQELADLAQREHPSDADRARMRAAAERQAEMKQALGDWREQAAQTAKRLEQRRPQLAQRLRAQSAAIASDHIAEQVGSSGAAARRGRGADARDQAEAAADALADIALPEGKNGRCGNGWCDGDDLGTCRGQLERLAKLGLSRGGSESGSGGGATGSSGHGLMVGPGGQPLPGAPVPLFGPEPLASRAGRHAGDGSDNRTAGPAATIAADGSLQPATAYQRGVRATTAGGGVPLSPGEQRMIDDYWRRLDGEALTPERRP